jgi:hypothetical protein
MNAKPCNICGIIGDERYTASPYCKKCHIKKSKENRRTKNERRGDRFRRLMAVEKDKPCVDCGVKYPTCVMDFDHLPQFKKSFEISSANGGSIKRIMDEIAKCELVCSNCHRMRTYTRKNEL